MKFQKPSLRLALFSLSFLVLFLFLGFWQLDRAQAKEVIIAEAEKRLNQPGELLEPTLDLEVGDPVRIEGQFDSSVTLLSDNKVLKGRVGYEVIQLFKATNGMAILVNRGFVPGHQTRDQLPIIPQSSEMQQTIRGHAYLSELAVPDENLAGAASPWVVQVVKPEALETEIGVDLYPFEVRLEEQHFDALPRHWPVTTMPPERHMGYAITWFMMALAISLAFAFTMLKPK